MEPEMLNSYVGDSTGYYERPSVYSLQTAQNLFQQVLETRSIPSPKEAAKTWATLGFSIKQVTEGDQEFAVIFESPKFRGRGNGFYIIKLNSRLPSSSEQSSSSGCNVVLQAMHTPSDMHIHRVAFKLLMESKIYIAAAWNTIHRNKADLGKEPFSYFNSFTSAVARSSSKPRVVQLHAFDAKSHKINGDVILSSSRFQEPSEQYERVVSRMRAELKGFVILHFPREIMQLGGTRNVNARVFYENNPQGLFFHVEMSLPLRINLRDKIDLRSSFTKCFI